MIYEDDSLFYYKKIYEDNIKNISLYNITSILFEIDVALFQENGMSEQKIIDKLSKKYNLKYLKTTYLKKMINDYCLIKEKGKYYLEMEKRKTIIDMLEFKKILGNISNYDEKELYDDLKNKECYDYENLKRMLYSYFLLNIKYEKIDVEYASALIYKILLNAEKDADILKYNIENIKKEYNYLSINEAFPVNEIINNILVINDLNSINDLKNCSEYFIMVLFALNYITFLDIVKKFTIGYYDLIKIYFGDLDDREINILLKRKDYLGKNLTLSELGNKYNTTRERIRQIESKAIQKVKKISKELNLAFLALYYSIKYKRAKYITLEMLQAKIHPDLIEKVLLIYQYGELNIVYDNRYCILYDDTYYKINEMIEEEINKFGVVADYKETENADLFKKKILELHYKKIFENVYLLRGKQQTDLYLDLIENNFQNGFNVTSDYEEFSKLVTDNYKILEIPSEHTLRAALGRIDRFILCDKGTYISKKNNGAISDELYAKIIDYISNNSYTYYSAIYETFEKELNEQGIKNRFHLKGCLDALLPEEMNAKRDCVSVGNKQNSLREDVVKCMRSYPGEFCIADLQKKFIGINDLIIQSICYKEISNGLIFISGSRYIYFDKTGIDETTVKELKVFIDSLFSKMETKILSSKKIYARLQLMSRSLFDRLKILGGHYYLFSIIKVLYKDYFYSRPFISIEDENYTRESVIQKYVEQFDEFDFKLILDYQRKMNIGHLYSYLEFMEEMSDDYVQVDIDKMISKRNIEISENELLNFKKVIDLILKNFDVIKTETFNGYSLFPKIKYEWNKYLMVGIIRTYYNNEYEINNTTAMYSTTEFEIRRINDGE